MYKYIYICIIFLCGWVISTTNEGYGFPWLLILVDHDQSVVDITLRGEAMAPPMSRLAKLSLQGER